ncbi:MAG: cob(I)yrinic acid a,c-diamide adenosyltransferase [Parcubacteria group bacterium]|nr:cob(I)yrinic acid a,c-diamide adenosyltransferase [Parcubacteria group bacterium]|tara:strand:- start:1595 stop:2116 length:522 start_codon:yes stop_codon:yes gene_type:complete
MKSDLGKIHVYTGDGKGKTTSSFGLTMRAIGAGYKVYIIQFLKGQDYSELKIIKKLPKVGFKRFGLKTFVYQKGTRVDKSLAKQALDWSFKIVKSGKYDMVILDEIFPAVFFKLIKNSDIIKIIKAKPENVELVMTGRRAPEQVIKLADYVTDMKEVKHPYQKGLVARKGIED